MDKDAIPALSFLIRRLRSSVASVPSVVKRFSLELGLTLQDRFLRVSVALW